jgi:hypothetical protein
MTKNEFIAWLHKHVDRFSAWWDALSKEYPEATPETLPEPDWFEQFEMYIDSDESSKDLKALADEKES